MLNVEETNERHSRQRRVKPSQDLLWEESKVEGSFGVNDGSTGELLSCPQQSLKKPEPGLYHNTPSIVTRDSMKNGYYKRNPVE